MPALLGLVGGHIVTKALALRFLLQGRRGPARVAWRWMANRPTPADTAKARADLERPHVKAALEQLRRETPQ